jgi:glycosyltransferase involved in cell wall biosynthesis
MSGADTRHVVIIAPNLDRDDVGETGTSFQLLRAMADIGAATGGLRLTVLVLQRPGRVPAAAQLPDLTVVEWPEPAWLLRLERFNAMLKPAIPPFYRKVRRWLQAEIAAGQRIDLVHQMLPRAPRYASPLPGLGLPYIIGPVGGAIPMPDAFRTGGDERWFTRLRGLDAQRFARDPWLRRGFGGADLVLGVAPYMQGVLADMPIRRFAPFLGIGVDAPAPPLVRAMIPGQLRLLHVGRAVRTKGLREAVRALALLPDLAQVTLTVVGDGDEIAAAARIVAETGLGARVQFLGHRPRAAIETLYQTHDALLFPSFRESMGAVLYEAMRWGMPVITVDHGGPGYIVDDSCGLRAALTTPDQLPRDLATLIRRLATDTALRADLGAGARARVAAEALWPAKARRMIGLYESVLADHASGQLSGPQLSGPHTTRRHLA